MEGNLGEVYYDPKSVGSFGGVNALRKQVKLPQDKVIDWLSSQDTYTLHKPIRKRWKRRRVVVSGVDDQWQADLVDMSKLARFNDGYKYLVTCIDVFSKYAWVVPIKNKTGASLVDAFEVIVGERKPFRLQTDQGKEFINRKFQKWLQVRGIHFFHSFTTETKAQIVERFNRTLKNRVWRYFTRHATQRYIHVLQDFVTVYNHAHHRSIKRSPVSVTKENQEEVWEELNLLDISQPKTPRLKVGDKVRIAAHRGKFKKGYTDNWTQEIFFVRGVQKTNPPVYVIEDFNKDEIKGSFYEEELQKIRKTDETYRVERVLARRRKQGKTFLLVKWLGYPDSFNSWVCEEDVVSEQD